MHNFTEPTGLLSDCHRRIEMFMGTLKAVAAVIDRLPAEDTVRALESALRYFGEAAPKHTADEEVSLFPWLRQMGLPEIDSAFAELEHLEDEHRWTAPLHARIEDEDLTSSACENCPDDSHQQIIGSRRWRPDAIPSLHQTTQSPW